MNKAVCQESKLNWQEIRVFFEQGLVGTSNGCIFTRNDLETISVQLAADIIFRLVSSVPEFDTVQKVQVLSHGRTCPKLHPQWLPSSILNA